MSQTKQKRWTNKVFDILREEGFRPIDIEFGNGYFIFEHGKDMVVHFHIKELKGWKFGIWWDPDGEKKFDFFTQYERDIDKFKPSASTLVQEGVVLNLDEVDVRYYLVRMCRFIKKHPYRAWSIDQTFTQKIWDWDMHKGCFLEYWREWWFRSVRAPRVHEKMRKKYLKIIEPITTSCLINPKIIDSNEDGWACSPRYSVVCDGFIGEKLYPGHYYTIDFLQDLDGLLLKKVERYNKKFAGYGGRYEFVLADIYLGDNLGFTVRDKAKHKKGAKE